MAMSRTNIDVIHALLQNENYYWLLALRELDKLPYDLYMRKTMGLHSAEHKTNFIVSLNYNAGLLTFITDAGY